MTPDRYDDCLSIPAREDRHAGESYERDGAGTDDLVSVLDGAGGGARHRQRAAYARGERPELLCGNARVSRPSGVFQF